MIQSAGLSVKYLKKQPYSGSHQGMRFRLHAPKDSDNVSVWIYPEPGASSRAGGRQDLKGVPITPEGLEEAIRWLNASYEEKREYWKECEKIRCVSEDFQRILFFYAALSFLHLRLKDQGSKVAEDQGGGDPGGACFEPAQEDPQESLLVHSLPHPVPQKIAKPDQRHAGPRPGELLEGGIEPRAPRTAPLHTNSTMIRPGISLVRSSRICARRRSGRR